jgi:hypothetical protein
MHIYVEETLDNPIQLHEGNLDDISIFRGQRALQPHSSEGSLDEDGSK